MAKVARFVTYSVTPRPMAQVREVEFGSQILKSFTLVDDRTKTTAKMTKKNFATSKNNPKITSARALKFFSPSDKDQSGTDQLDDTMILVDLLLTPYIDCYNGQLGTYSERNRQRISMTKSGIQCQRWDAQYPHIPKKCFENMR